MRWRTIGITALFVLGCAVAIACGASGGGDTTTIITKRSFPQGFLPLLLEGSLADPCQSAVVRTAGDVALGDEGDLFAVAQNSEIYAVSRTDGSCRVFASVPIGTQLLSITLGTGDDARLFAGDAVGRIWVIPAGGGAVTTPYTDTGSQPITGLAFAPNGFGDVEGSLLAAAGTTGVVRITISDTPAFETFAAPSAGGSIVDLAFSGDTLFAVDPTLGDIDQVDVSGTTGTTTKFVQTGIAMPVGIAVDTDADEIYVADAGDDIIKTVPVAGGSATRRARYDFGTSAANGIAFDGVGALVWITSGPLAIRGSSLPRINPASADFNKIFLGPTAGYGDLELDRNGEFVLVANDEVDDPDVEDDVLNNFLFRVPRDPSKVDTLDSSIGTPPERLFAVATDPVDQTNYFSSFSLGAAVESGNIYARREPGEDEDEEDVEATLLLSLTPGVRVLGLEIAPPTFGGFGGHLIATTEDGRMFAIDPESPSTPVQISLSGPGLPVTHLVDLVFASTGELYAVDNNGNVDVATAARILGITPAGVVTVIAPSSSALGAADGIEIDEGGDRLLVTTETVGGFQLIEVSLGAIPATVKTLANIQIDNGFFPTGVVYDRLGTAVFRQGDANTQLGAVSVQP